MKLTILGTATPYPVPGNACSGYLLQSETGVVAGAGSEARVRVDAGHDDAGSAAGSTAIWVDAGTGTLAELQRHLAVTEIDAIWISHRHADHTADLLVAYYALRFSSAAEAAFGADAASAAGAGASMASAAAGPGAVGGRRRVRVIGPEALADRLADYLGPSAVQGLAEVFEFTEMNGWGDTMVGDLALSWGPVSHGVPAFALTVTPVTPAGAAGGRAGITYSGDTRACMSLVEMAEESRVLLCEVGYAQAPGGGDHVHQTPEDAGRTAAEAGVEKLILTHLRDDLEPTDAVRRASGTFDGTVHLATSGATFAV